MRHSLADATFEIPDEFDDESSYVYRTSDDSEVLRITPMPEARDPQSALDSSKKVFEDFFSPSIIYIRDATLRLPRRPEVPAYEGELANVDSNSATRFGLVALGKGPCIVQLLLLGPRKDFLTRLTHLVATVRFVDETPEAVAVPTFATVRQQANAATFELPRDWSAPTLLRFVHKRTRAASLRITTAEPICPKGAAALEKEFPTMVGERLNVLTQQIEVRGAEENGWAGEWVVEHLTRRGRRELIFRKACVSFPRFSSSVFTAYGKAPREHVSDMDSAWKHLMRTLRPRFDK